VPQILARDILWVECKAPCHDTPGGWKELITEASNRLATAHPTRMVFLITAVGAKWMFFKWDPNSLNPLIVLDRLLYNVQNAWTIPHRQLCFEPTIQGQRYRVSNSTTNALDAIDPRQAHTVDCVSLDANGQFIHGIDLLQLVDCLNHVKAAVFLDDNPSHFN
jgi:hypothetical protein